MSKWALCFTVATLFLGASRGPDRWLEADEWEDADLVIFFTGELRGYVEPCG